MKIVYVHGTDLSATTPSATFVTHNAESLARTGAEVHLVVQDSRPRDPARLEQRFGLRFPPNLHLHLFPEVGRRHWRFWRYAVRTIADLVAPDEPAIVITRAVGFVPHLWLLWRRRPRIRVFFETHDFYLDLALRDDIHRRRKLRDQWIERLLFPRLTGLLCLSETQRRLYARYLPAERLHVFPSGARAPLPESGAPRKRSLVYVGSLDPHKGVGDVYAVAARLGADVELEIVGARNEAEAGAARAAAARAGARATVHGWVDKEKLFGILREASLGLLPLRDVFFNRHLTVPLKLFDYYAAGLPVVATDLDSLRELTFGGETGLLVRWDDPGAAAERIRAVLDDPALYARYRSAVLRRREELTWARRARDQARFFEGVLAAS